MQKSIPLSKSIRIYIETIEMFFNSIGMCFESMQLDSESILMYFGRMPMCSESIPIHFASKRSYLKACKCFSKPRECNLKAYKYV